MPKSNDSSVGKRRLLIALTLPVAAVGLVLSARSGMNEGDSFVVSGLCCLCYWIAVGLWHWVSAGFRADKEAESKRVPKD